MANKPQPRATEKLAAAAALPPIATAAPGAAVDADPLIPRASAARQRKPVPARTAAGESKTHPRPQAKGPIRPATVAAVAPKAAPAKASKKAAKPRPVLVRDSFTMPEADFGLIAKLKATALGGQHAAKKSELLRAGLQLLAGLDAESLVAALNRLDTVKTGRPKKGH